MYNYKDYSFSVPLNKLVFSMLLLSFTLLFPFVVSHVDYVNAGDDDDDDDDDKIPRLASELPSDDLCVDCWSNKNIITGQGLIVGTNHVDYIIGSTFDDIVFAKSGSDVVFVDLGIDRVYGGNGEDSVEGGPGNDQLLGENGADSLFGGFDDDLLVGGPGNDHLFGDIGNDILIGGPGANYFDCGDGIDEILDFDPAKGDVMAGNCELF
jgi:Ca2+-binding RTX toxin-like protein